MTAYRRHFSRRLIVIFDQNRTKIEKVTANIETPVLILDSKKKRNSVILYHVNQAWYLNRLFSHHLAKQCKFCIKLYLQPIVLPIRPSFLISDLVDVKNSYWDNF